MGGVHVVLMQPISDSAALPKPETYLAPVEYSMKSPIYRESLTLLQ